MKGLKKLRRLFALLMAMIMVMGTCITTQAADTGSITITNAAVGETYSIYEMMSWFYDESTESYEYSFLVDWTGFFTNGEGSNYVDYVSYESGIAWKDGGSVEDFAKAALAYAKENEIVADKTIEAENTTIKFEGLEYGYYLVDSTLGALCSLTAATSDVEITDKNKTPTVTKEVQEGYYFGETNTAGIGDTVYFTTTITGVSNVSNLVLHDEMSSGLSLNEDDILITLNKKLNGTIEVDSKYYKVIAETTSLTDGCAFEIKFTDEFTALLDTSMVIYVEYNATVSEDAEIRGEGNPNKTYVTYGENGESTSDKTITYVYDLYIYKYDQETNDALEGAKFVLYKYVSGTKNYAVLDANQKISSWTDQLTDATELKSGSNGLIEVIGLDADDYYLEETEAPTGYTPLSDPVEFTITEEGELKKGNVTIEDTITIEDVTYDAIMIANGNGSAMPSTGGIGTTIFYVVGSIMALGAAVVLITRRRMHES